MATTYSTTQLARAAGVSYRQLDYWARSGLVTPSVADTVGQGHPRRWSPDDLTRIRVIAAAARTRNARIADLISS